MEWFFGSKWSSKKDVQLVEAKLEDLMKRMDAVERHLKEVEIKETRLREEDERKQMREEREQMRLEIRKVEDRRGA